jgi:hypothetical protein
MKICAKSPSISLPGSKLVPKTERSRSVSILFQRFSQRRSTAHSRKRGRRPRSASLMRWLSDSRNWSTLSIPKVVQNKMFVFSFFFWLRFHSVLNLTLGKHRLHKMKFSSGCTRGLSTEIHLDWNLSRRLSWEWLLLWEWTEQLRMLRGAEALWDGRERDEAVHHRWRIEVNEGDSIRLDIVKVALRPYFGLIWILFEWTRIASKFSRTFSVRYWLAVAPFLPSMSSWRI